MWPFSKINKLQTEVNLANNKLDEIIFEMQFIKSNESRRYDNLCRVLDMVVLEARESNKVLMDIMQKRLVQVELDLHQTAEESLTTAEILADSQVRIEQLANKFKEDRLLS